MVTTIRDVAREAGVSVQTVSNVMNRRPGVARPTRQRVREVVERLGYRPNVTARSLRTGRAPVIGFLVGNIANPYFAEVVRGAADAARAHGYSLILGNTDGQTDRVRSLLDAFQEHHVTGIVAAAGGTATDALQIFETFSERIPVVQLGYADPSDRISRVVVNDQRGGYVAAAHLLALGRRRPALLAGPAHSWAGLRRLEGYRAALGDWGIAEESGSISEGDFTFQSGYRNTLEILGRFHPDAIVAGNDLMAVGAIAALRERGLEAPGDVAVIGYDDSDIGRLYHPAISTIAQPKYEIGRRGVEVLLSQVDLKDKDPEAPWPAARTVVLDCELLVRRSSAGCAGEIRCGSIMDDAPWTVGLSDGNTIAPRAHVRSARPRAGAGEETAGRPEGPGRAWSKEKEDRAM